MTYELFLFYVFSAALLYASTMVITQRNSVHSALFLVLAFCCAAGIWLLAEAEFLAIVLILVYVGAVMVLFLFVVMMLDVDRASNRAGYMKYASVGVLIAVVLAVEIMLVVGPGNFGLEKYPALVPQAADYSNTKELGRVLYTVYMYPFELAAVILLVAIIAAIGLTLRKRPQTRYQDPSKQVQVKASDRVRIVKMATEKKMELK